MAGLMANISTSRTSLLQGQRWSENNIQRLLNLNIDNKYIIGILLTALKESDSYINIDEIISKVK